MKIRKSRTNKHIPIRTCVVCGEKRRKAELIRLIFNGKFTVDDRHKMPGRGAYLCGKSVCAERLASRRVMKRAFGVKEISRAELSAIVNALMESFT